MLKGAPIVFWGAALARPIELPKEVLSLLTPERAAVHPLMVRVARSRRPSLRRSITDGRGSPPPRSNALSRDPASRTPAL